MYNQQKEEQKFINVISKGKYKAQRHQPARQNSSFISYFQSRISDCIQNGQQVYSSYALLNEFFNALSTENYLLNVACSEVFKNTMSYSFSQSFYNYVCYTKSPVSYLGGNVSMMPTSTIYNTFSAALEKKDKQVSNLIKAVKNRLSIRIIPAKSRNAKDQYVIEFKPFKDSKYFEVINNVVKEMIADININFQISKNETSARVFDRYLYESDKSYFSSLIGETSKLASCSTSIIKSVLGYKNSSISMPELTIKYSDKRAKLMLAIEKGMTYLADNRF